MNTNEFDKKLAEITKKIDSAADAIQSLCDDFSNDSGLAARLVEKFLLENLATLRAAGVKIEELKFYNSAK